MITEPTVFVLGAGASKPYGFPTGDELRRLICGLPNGGPLTQKLEVLGYGMDRFRRLAAALASSAVPSIDAFLARRSDHDFAGKAAMAAILLSREVGEDLQRVDGVHGRLDWYGELWARMIDGVHNVSELVESNNLRFITFNYDRSLERFLHDAIKNTFNIEDRQATEALNRFPILHVYGSLGPFEPGLRRFSYGWPQDPDAHDGVFDTAVGSIRVVPVDREGLDPISAEVLQGAERVVILGFGFDSVNCHRLGLAEVAARRMAEHPGSLKPKVYATTLGLTDAQVGRGMGNLLGGASGVEAGLHLQHANCLDALRHWDVLR